MPHCEGCGGKVSSPPETYGHILGCGEPGRKNDDDTHPVGQHDRVNRWAEARQKAILKAALESVVQRPTDEQADRLAKALQRILQGEGQPP